VVLEKPLGHDLASEPRHQRHAAPVLQEDQVFRIDHYLGKPSVQNLFALRFGNALFEPLWRRETLPTSRSPSPKNWAWKPRRLLRPDRRALRDMVQNHALQLLCAIGMEPPINASADAIRDEKLKVLRSLKPWTPTPSASMWCAGSMPPARARARPCRATAGKRRGPHSTTETFVALRTEISNWRWAGVPFYIRTGKRLAGRDAQHRGQLPARAPPDFQDPQIGAANRLVINLQPKDGLELHLLAQGANRSTRPNPPWRRCT
jgi:glucose-6-phosphate 1-dehydrogenase